ncbi:hypothetical protein N7495_008542 [Penicillium taxi]|uniref:uncharacterized protein n=1 Tax=Penicillium taxi TaxID=168475 RepID=UPI002544D5A4|nr:uncharacterized protein N7495_008542 [Penicillium taxi]KAJ5888501.1 hypothetical protein N7495_008542 [Penicillium taxi]
MGGSAHRNLSMFKKLCGHDGMKNVMSLTAFWEDVNESVGKKRELERGAKVRRHRNNRDSALSCLEEFIPVDWNQPGEGMKLAIQTEMVESRKDLDQTSAGQELNSVLKKQREKLQQEMEESKHEIKEAMKLQEREVVERLCQDQEKQVKELVRREQDMKALKISMQRMQNDHIKKLQYQIL